MLKRLLMQGIGAALKEIHGMGLSENEIVNVGGDRYPIAEFMGFSDQKITSILELAGATPAQIEQTFAWLRGMGRK
jgi:hypothetical protein